MKKICLFASIFISACTFIKAQGFIRIYNSSSVKIAKGILVNRFNNDSFLIVQRNKSNDTIAIQEVEYIKTKHAIGNNILIGALIGAPIGAILGGASASVTNDVYDPITGPILGETGIADVGAGIAIGFLGGAATGAAVGAITGAFKNSKTITINGDVQTWRKVRAQL